VCDVLLCVILTELAAAAENSTTKPSTRIYTGPKQLFNLSFKVHHFIIIIIIIISIIIIIILIILYLILISISILTVIFFSCCSLSFWAKL